MYKYDPNDWKRISLGNTCGPYYTIDEIFARKRIEDMNVNSPKHVSGTKESDGKLNYELDWNFIQGMAEKMALNKGKYEPYNWKKPIDVELLKQSLLRHVVEIMKGEYGDDGRDFGHFESASLNCMMIHYQLKNKIKP